MGDGVVHMWARLRYSPIHSGGFMQEALLRMPFPLLELGELVTRP
jgi:hypothetical protein